MSLTALNASAHNSCMQRRILIGLLVAFLLAGAAFVTLLREPRFGLNPGMTRTQVEACIGRPPDETGVYTGPWTGFATKSVWDDESLTVIFGKDDRVEYWV